MKIPWRLHCFHASYPKPPFRRSTGDLITTSDLKTIYFIIYCLYFVGLASSFTSISSLFNFIPEICIYFYLF